MKEAVLWTLACLPGAFVLWGSWRVFRLVVRAKGGALDDMEREQREVRASARYPREPR